DDRRGYSRHHLGSRPYQHHDEHSDRRSYHSMRGDSRRSPPPGEMKLNTGLTDITQGIVTSRTREVASRNSLSSHTPPPRPIRERLDYPNEVSSERTLSTSRERRSALARIAEPDLRDNLPRSSPHNLETDSTQGRTDHEDGLSQQNNVLPSGLSKRGSTSAPRVSATLRIQEPQIMDNVNITIPPSVQKSTGKRKVPSSSRKRVPRSPLKGLKLRKAGIIKPQNLPRKRFCSDRDPTLPCNKAGSIGLSGGLCLLWKDGVDISILESSPNLIDTKVEFKGVSTFISFIYGAPAMENRAAFWAKLTEVGRNRDSPWLITGDFNDILNNSEKSGGPARWEGSFTALRSFVSQNGLWDLKHSGN
ncbi:unnamed protein product, partial [Brassica rapa]